MPGSVGNAAMLVLLLALPASAAPAGAAQLLELARARFGDLTAAEVTLARDASSRALAWVGPNANPDDPANDAAHGADWGPERTIRPELLRWITSDPEAGRLVDPSGIGVAGARIDGPLDLSYGRVDKPITIVRSYVPDGVDLRSAHVQDFVIRSSVTGAIVTDLAEIAGDLAVRYGTHGTLSLFRAKIAGGLDCTGSTFASARGTAVNAVESTIGGDAVFHDGFAADGMVDVRLAHIGQSLSFHDVRFTGDDETGLNAERAVVGGALYWVEIAHTPHTQLDLENAHADALWDDMPSWPAPGKLAIDGFTYTQFSGGPVDAGSRLMWLRLQPQDDRPQPYRQLATVLRESGRDIDATDVLIAKEEARRRDPTLGVGPRAWNLMLGLTIGYGYRPLRALWWIGGFVLLGSILFTLGHRARIVTPIEETAYYVFLDSGAAPPHYPSFHPFMYALENFLPVVDLHQGEYWRPNPLHRVGGGTLGTLPDRLLLWYLWFHILAGWALTPLLFAGLSGLVRPD